MPGFSGKWGGGLGDLGAQTPVFPTLFASPTGRGCWRRRWSG